MSLICDYCKLNVKRLKKLTDVPDLRQVFKNLQDDASICVKCSKKARIIVDKVPKQVVLEAYYRRLKLKEEKRLAQEAALHKPQNIENEALKNNTGQPENYKNKINVLSVEKVSGYKYNTKAVCGSSNIQQTEILSVKNIKNPAAPGRHEFVDKLEIVEKATKQISNLNHDIPDTTTPIVHKSVYQILTTESEKNSQNKKPVEIQRSNLNVVRKVIPTTSTSITSTQKPLNKISSTGSKTLVTKNVQHNTYTECENNKSENAITVDDYQFSKNSDCGKSVTKILSTQNGYLVSSNVLQNKKNIAVKDNIKKSVKPEFVKDRQIGQKFRSLKSPKKILSTQNGYLISKNIKNNESSKIGANIKKLTKPVSSTESEYLVSKTPAQNKNPFILDNTKMPKYPTIRDHQFSTKIDSLQSGLKLNPFQNEHLVSKNTVQNENPVNLDNNEVSINSDLKLGTKVSLPEKINLVSNNTIQSKKSDVIPKNYMSVEPISTEDYQFAKKPDCLKYTKAIIPLNNLVSKSADPKLKSMQIPNNTKTLNSISSNITENQTPLISRENSSELNVQKPKINFHNIGMSKVKTKEGTILTYQIFIPRKAKELSAKSDCADDSVIEETAIQSVILPNIMCTIPTNVLENISSENLTSKINTDSTDMSLVKDTLTTESNNSVHIKQEIMAQENVSTFNYENKCNESQQFIGELEKLKMQAIKSEDSVSPCKDILNVPQVIDLTENNILSPTKNGAYTNPFGIVLTNIHTISQSEFEEMGNSNVCMNLNNQVIKENKKIVVSDEAQPEPKTKILEPSIECDKSKLYLNSITKLVESPICMNLDNQIIEENKKLVENYEAEKKIQIVESDVECDKLCVCSSAIENLIEGSVCTNLNNRLVEENKVSVIQDELEMKHQTLNHSIEYDKSNICLNSIQNLVESPVIKTKYLKIKNNAGSKIKLKEGNSVLKRKRSKDRNVDTNFNEPQIGCGSKVRNHSIGSIKSRGRQKRSKKSNTNTHFKENAKMFNKKVIQEESVDNNIDISSVLNCNEFQNRKGNEQVDRLNSKLAYTDLKKRKLNCSVSTTNSASSYNTDVKKCSVILHKIDSSSSYNSNMSSARRLRSNSSVLSNNVSQEVVRKKSIGEITLIGSNKAKSNKSNKEDKIIHENQEIDDTATTIIFEDYVQNSINEIPLSILQHSENSKNCIGRKRSCQESQDLKEIYSDQMKNKSKKRKTINNAGESKIYELTRENLAKFTSLMNKEFRQSYIKEKILQYCCNKSYSIDSLDSSNQNIIDVDLDPSISNFTVIDLDRLHDNLSDEKVLVTEFDKLIENTDLGNDNKKIVSSNIQDPNVMKKKDSINEIAEKCKFNKSTNSATARIDINLVINNREELQNKSVNNMGNLNEQFKSAMKISGEDTNKLKSNMMEKLMLQNLLNESVEFNVDHDSDNIDNNLEIELVDVNKRNTDNMLEDHRSISEELRILGRAIKKNNVQVDFEKVLQDVNSNMSNIISELGASNDLLKCKNTDNKDFMVSKLGEEIDISENCINNCNTKYTDNSIKRPEVVEEVQNTISIFKATHCEKEIAGKIQNNISGNVQKLVSNNLCINAETSNIEPEQINSEEPPIDNLSQNSNNQRLVRDHLKKDFINALVSRNVASDELEKTLPVYTKVDNLEQYLIKENVEYIFPTNFFEGNVESNQNDPETVHNIITTELSDNTENEKLLNQNLDTVIDGINKTTNTDVFDISPVTKIISNFIQSGTFANMWTRKLSLLHNEKITDQNHITKIGPLPEISIRNILWSIDCDAKIKNDIRHRCYKTMNSFEKPACLVKNCKNGNLRFNCSGILDSGCLQIELNGQESHRILLGLSKEVWNDVCRLVYSLGEYRFHKGKLDRRKHPLQSSLLDLIIRTAPKIGHLMLLYQKVDGRRGLLLRSIDASKSSDDSYRKNSESTAKFALRPKTMELLKKGVKFQNDVVNVQNNIKLYSVEISCLEKNIENEATDRNIILEKAERIKLNLRKSKMDLANLLKEGKNLF